MLWNNVSSNLEVDSNTEKTASNFTSFLERISSFLPTSRVFQDSLLRIAYSIDASIYKLTPKLVLKLDNEIEVQQVLKAALDYKVSLTFRAAGTSLSGQAVTDSVLILLTDNWKNYQVLNQGKLFKTQPKLTGAQVNRILKPYARKIGPDPASIDSAQIGGMAANNSSGMCCGVKNNSYHTLQDLRIILSDGTLLDTADRASVDNFRKEKEHLLSELLKIREEMILDKPLISLLRQKYKIKNTMGYSLNAFLDYSDPVDILKHLIIGSEGTLAFISKITYHTVPEHLFKATGLFLFSDLAAALKVVKILQEQEINAVELMDYLSLSTIINEAILSTISLPSSECVALLIEVGADEEEKLDKLIQQVEASLSEIEIPAKIPFSKEEAVIQKLWALRKGLYPTASTFRPDGTTIIIEDVAFPINELEQAIPALQKLFQKHDYSQSVIFGHALVGNLHFLVANDFSDPQEIERYKNFMGDLASLVVQYNGSLKAEHGTGRNTAPFLKQEWQETAYKLMQRLKQIIDPHNILNPGIILNEDQEIHIKNLKQVPLVNSIFDKCIECGFCERLCPSESITFTPRQRISVWRHLSNENLVEAENLDELKKSYDYFGDATCTTCGLCQTACPVKIDAGEFILHYRKAKTNQAPVADWFGQNFRMAKNSTKSLLQLAKLTQKVIPPSKMEYISNLFHQHLKTPAWNRFMPLPAKHYRVPKLRSDKKLIYFPSCISQAMTSCSLKIPQSLPDTVIEIFEAVGVQLIFPKNLFALCCGKLFQSKGYETTANNKMHELEKSIAEINPSKNYPILCDTSPCTYYLKEHLEERGWSVMDSVEALDEFVMPQIDTRTKKEQIMLHPVCSLCKMGLKDKLIQVASQLAQEVIVPDDVYCCGVAGDKIFHYPELSQAALKNLPSQIPTTCNQGYSTALTCEVGLSLHSGIAYHSLFYLIQEALHKTEQLSLKELE